MSTSATRTTHPDLQEERARASFNVEELAAFLAGGKDKLERKRFLMNLVESDPVFSNRDRIYLSRPDYYVRNMQKQKRLIDLKIQHKLDHADYVQLRDYTSDLGNLYLHDELFIPTLKGQMSDEQLKDWLPLAESYKIYGCYAQTELGHGSNIRKLETTATYIQETDEFELHSPTLSSLKWWPGALARTSTHTVVFAQLIIKGKNYGLHSFLLQLRSLKDHSPLPGIELGDIGPKLGFNAVDNGFLRMNKVRIPRNQMLMRFAKVSNTGEYSTPPHPKLTYGTMIAIRADIVSGAGKALAHGLTISIRYSVIRKQGDSVEDPTKEYKILDYPVHQQRLFTALGHSYSLFFTGEYMRNLYIKTKNNPEVDVSQLAELHALSSGLKALCSEIVSNALEDLRRSCGGHGYSALSGFPIMIGTYVQNVTVEGDNVILHMQTGRYLLSLLRKIRELGIESGPENSGGLLAYLPEVGKGGAIFTRYQSVSSLDLYDPHIQQRLLQLRDLKLLEETESKFNTLSKKEGDAAARHKLQPILVKLSRAFCETALLHNFIEGLESLPDSSSFKHCLRSLCSLVGAYFLESAKGDLLEFDLISPQLAKQFRELTPPLLHKIRPDALALIEAFEFGDNALASSLGRKDGRVYEDLYEWALMDPANVLERQKGTILGYDVLKSIYQTSAKL